MERKGGCLAEIKVLLFPPGHPGASSDCCDISPVLFKTWKIRASQQEPPTFQCRLLEHFHGIEVVAVWRCYFSHQENLREKNTTFTKH